MTCKLCFNVIVAVVGISVASPTLGAAAGIAVTAVANTALGEVQGAICAAVCEQSNVPR